MAETHTVAIVGAGIGAEHMKAYQALADRFRVRTVCDLDEERGRGLAAKNAGSGFTAQLDDVLADLDIELVDICLPPHVHYSACVVALVAGKYVVCEKPLVP
ncbi:MAG: Gfo/Idh/MocA family protein, partial [Alphaproteobacteria bacterium]